MKQVLKKPKFLTLLELPPKNYRPGLYLFLDARPGEIANLVLEKGLPCPVSSVFIKSCENANLMVS